MDIFVILRVVEREVLEIIIPESYMCDITKTEWADLYQYFDYLVTTFGSNE